MVDTETFSPQELSGLAWRNLRQISPHLNSTALRSRVVVRTQRMRRSTRWPSSHRLHTRRVPLQRAARRKPSGPVPRRVQAPSVVESRAAQAGLPHTPEDPVESPMSSQQLLQSHARGGVTRLVTRARTRFSFSPTSELGSVGRVRAAVGRAQLSRCDGLSHRWQCFALRPLPHGQGSFRPVFVMTSRTSSA